MPTIKPFHYIEELDAFIETEEFVALSNQLGLTEWHASVWIGRLFMLDQDYGEHWFDNWDQREDIEDKAEALGYDSYQLLIVASDRFSGGGDGPCNTPELRKAFWTDVLKSLELSYDLLFQKARARNVKVEPTIINDYIEDLESRIEEIKRSLQEK